MKLTTKIGISFLIVILLIGGVGLWGIPKLREYLIEREKEYARSFLLRETQYAQKQIQSLLKQARNENWDTTQWQEEMRKLFQQLDSIFTQHYAHLTGRLFVIDINGQVLYSTDVTRSGKTITNFWIYDDGTRGKFLQVLKESAEHRNLVYLFPVMEVQNNHTTPKTVFVSLLSDRFLDTHYFLCISENDSDLYQFADLISHALELSIAITILIFYLIFQIFYTGLHRRYERILEQIKSIAKGNYETLIQDKEKDEIGILAQTIDDLTKRLKTEKEKEKLYFQMQKMEIMGTMASGIAHDFNNMLTGILSGIELVTQEIEVLPLQNAEKIKNSLRLTRDCAIRGKETVEKLLSFSRKREINVHPVDFNAVVRSVVELCRHSFDKRIRIHFRETDRPAIILADHSLLEQALMNICINARDAIGENHGTIELELKEIFSTDTPPQKFYQLRITDNGCGMDEATLQHLFEPFYTTKKKGTGLGMTMVYLTLQEIGGSCEVKSKLAEGTTVYITIPAYNDLESPTTTPSPEYSLHSSASSSLVQPSTSSLSPSSSPKGDNSTGVLIIDDDVFMLQMTSDILQRLGYQSFMAPTGKEGLEILKQHSHEIEIVILDLMLPEESGEEIFPKLKRIKETIKVLLVSGNKRDPRIATMLANGCDSFLNKPFSLNDIKEALEQLQNSSSSSK